MLACAHSSYGTNYGDADACIPLESARFSQVFIIIGGEAIIVKKNCDGISENKSGPDLGPRSLATCVFFAQAWGNGTRAPIQLAQPLIDFFSGNAEFGGHFFQAKAVFVHSYEHLIGFSGPAWSRHEGTPPGKAMCSALLCCDGGPNMLHGAGGRRFEPNGSAPEFGATRDLGYDRRRMRLPRFGTMDGEGVMSFQPLFYTGRFMRRVIPAVGRELERWVQRAERIPNDNLRRQALASLRMKRFHAEGGSVFAAAHPDHIGRLVPLIVALQTISDYLDNLGDRTSSLDEQDFRALHQAMLDAVGTTPVSGDYYRYHPDQDDGGYLQALVETCRRETARLPFYDRVQPLVVSHVERYCDLQVYKHLPWSEREQRLITWHQNHPDASADMDWWEFAAACGSTLGMFALFAEALSPASPERLKTVSNAYFPWVCGLHILLDYLIDLEEDAREGDLNFVSYYSDVDLAVERLTLFVQRAVAAVRQLPDYGFHLTVVEGLLAMYLSDRKVEQQQLQSVVRQLLAACGPRARLTHWLCKKWRYRWRG